MVYLRSSYFTNAIVNEIRTTDLKAFFKKHWCLYRAYHNQTEKVSSKNAVYIMNEFQNKIEVIASIPKQYVSPQNLARLIGRKEN
jgi:hypothetical protein